MADNVDITPGSGNTIAADEVVDGTLGAVKVQYIKIMDGTIDGTNKAAVTANGLAVDGSAVVQPVSGPLTDTQLRATPVPVSGTIVVTPSGTQDVNIVSTIPLPVTGTFFQATQPISAASLPLPTGASTEATLLGIKTATDQLTFTATRLLVDGSGVTQPVSGPLTDAQLRATPVPVVGSITTSPNVNVHDGTGVSISSTGSSLNVDVTNTVPVTGTFFQATQPISAVSLPLPTGAATEATLLAAKLDLDKFTFTATRLLVDGSGVTQPVSGTVTANQGTSPWVVSGSITTSPNVNVHDGTGTSISSTGSSLNVDVTNTVPVTGTFFQATQPVSGPLTDTQLRAAPVPVSGTVTVTPSGTQNVSIVSTITLPVSGPLTDTQLRATPVPISGTVTSNIGTTGGLALDATLTNSTQKTQNVDGTGNVVGPNQTISGTNYLPVVLASSGTPGAAVPARTIQVGGSDGTNIQTLKVSTTGVLAVSTTSDAVSTASLTNVPSSTSSQQILAANATRKSVIIMNDSTGKQMVKYGTTASATSLTVIIPANSYWEMPLPVYTGRMDAISSNTNGAMRITEL